MKSRAKFLFLIAAGTLSIIGILAFLFLSMSTKVDYPPGQTRQRPANTNKSSGRNIPSRVDNIINNMDWGNIAFNAPERMKLESSSTIQLVLSPTSSIDELKEVIAAEGEKEGARVRVSDVMEARLSGVGFQISSITPEVQAVSWKEVTEWKWDVVPTRPGRHNLYLTLTAIINVEGSTMPRRIRTFDRTIEVEVSAWQTAFKFFQQNWEWLWTLIVFPLGLWVWRRQLKKNAIEASGSMSC